MSSNSTSRRKDAQICARPLTNDSPAKRRPRFPTDGPCWRRLFRRVAWLHGPEQTAAGPARQEPGGAHGRWWTETRRTDVTITFFIPVESHPSSVTFSNFTTSSSSSSFIFSDRIQQTLWRHQFIRQPVWSQLQRLLRLLSLLQTQPRVSKRLHVSQIEGHGRQSHLSHPEEVHLCHLWSQRRLRTHTPLLSTDAAARG